MDKRKKRPRSILPAHDSVPPIYVYKWYPIIDSNGYIYPLISTSLPIPCFSPWHYAFSVAATPRRAATPPIPPELGSIIRCYNLASTWEQVTEL
ncbi:hypothetical protein SLA2020_241580 [Shorea laevis]